MAAKTFQVEIEREEGYRMRATPGRERAPSLLIDEHPPLGQGRGASPTELLASAVGSCLTASLLFCLEKSRVPVDGIRTRVEGSLERNEAGRFRVEGMRVEVEINVDEAHRKKLDRCLGLFEDFCIVKESVRGGIPISVEVKEGTPEFVG